jgi:outer membrane receptor protein involved in Fe transport
MGDGHELSFGANLRRRDTTIEGLQPADSTDYLPGAPTRPIETRPAIDYPGWFVEDKLRLFGPLYATLGARFDHASPPDRWTADPRATLAWRLGDHQTLRLAAGRYHQPAKAEYLDPIYGNPNLGVLRADHLIAGYEWSSDYGTVRLEAYRKDYRDLVTQDSLTFYANGGYGYARGVDAMVQGTLGWLSGWVSYGWLDSRRKELDHPTEVPSEYGVRHALTVVGKYRMTSEWELGGKFGWTTGRPFTPVAGSTWDPARGIWHPIYGEHHSEEIPAFRRLDVRLTRLFSLPPLGGLPESGVCVFFVECLNALDTRNVLDYVYNDDYSERRAIDSYFSRRMAVAGFSLSW